MKGIARGYIRFIDRINYLIGRVVMLGIFGMVGVLLWSSISKTFFLPSLWTLETAQFAMVAYYMLGGPYSIQLGSNVRMDLLYGSWTRRGQARMDVFTVLFLIFYLGVLAYGAFESTMYSLGYFGSNPFVYAWEIVVAFFTGGPEAAREMFGHMERSPTAWRPVMWPIKMVMLVGVLLMLLQAVSELLKDMLRLRGEEI